MGPGLFRAVKRQTIGTFCPFDSSYLAAKGQNDVLHARRAPVTRDWSRTTSRKISACAPCLTPSPEQPACGIPHGRRPGRERVLCAGAGGGDLTVRAPIDGHPEVRTLASRFNEMVSQLDELLDSQSAFVADASHQLRTPLASLRLRLENLQHDVADPGQPGLASALTEVERLSQLVDQLLALARADGAGLTPATDIDLRSMIDERTEFWAALAEEQAVELIASSGPRVLARAAQGRIEQVIDNLIENALETCNAGGTVEISCKSDGVWAQVHIEDDGPGMSAEQRDRAFDRFWRAQSSGEGSGLGLAIVDRLVALDDGTVELAASAAGGGVAIVRLPLADSRESRP
jgi:signal transduction histidine kinase